MKRLRFELTNLKNSDGRVIALPSIVIAIDTGEKEFCISIACLWYVFTIQYYYGQDLDC
jgi:hypothetical protein